MSEHDFESVRGLPGALPEGETILWQGAPNGLSLAQQAFHVRAVAAYFGLMLVWRTAGAVMGGEAPTAALTSALAVAPIALLAVGILGGLAWLNSRTTVYTITNRRVVLRFGAAIPKAINIPFAIIESAALKPVSNGCGDLALTLKAPNKIAFLHLWPHARPWRIAAPQPTFRALPNARAVATILASAIADQVPIELARPSDPSPQSSREPGLARPETVAA
ncbi:photosynthetic complex putative assembly protein PuhB [Phenylobacterium sp.]|uniref:photosynthetic complex putative assembly protein PuhB n=1 Tax=Phenylobacterium sp. TaxID=1871053 RepID=UPI0025E5F053|nr:photosynthetic complex putative assembly protein PuhB [Phenylobacterium sp.]